MVVNLLVALALIMSLVLITSPGRIARADNITQSLPFSQNWTNIGLITTNDDWSGVPGIVGFLGQDITTSAGIDPQTLLGVSALANDVDVIANQTNPNITNGGVAEFEIVNPTIALQGSGTADAPYIVLYLNTIGQSNITVAYNLRDIDSSADNAVQPVALQYRIGASGNFTNLPAGFVADATTGPSLATLVTPVGVQLPAAAENQPEVQVRIITTNAAGNDEWVGIDDISVSASVADVAPSVLTTTPANGASNVAVSSNITVNFSEAVDVAAGAITVECPASTVVASNAAADNVSSIVIDPVSDLPFSTTCVINVAASGVTDEDTNDPPDNMDADHLVSFDTVSGAVTAAALVINEIDYDQPSTDTAEFVEIRNNDSVSVDLSGYSIQMVNGNAGGAAQYRLFALPAVSLAPGDYFVLCANNTTVANCDLDVSPDTDLIQNGAPDAVALLFNGSVIDTVSYEGDTGTPYTEGTGTGVVDDPAFTDAGISRCPNGSDTHQNNVDFSFHKTTPGAANACLPAGVINEIDYDQPGTDTAEFIELRNNDLFSFDLSSFSLELVNGNAGGAAIYQTITLPAVNLASGDYFVVCANATTVANCDLDVTPDTNLIQNGAPDAVGLRYNGSLIDAVSYEGDTGAPYTEGSGVGLEDNAANANEGISRCPDGADTNHNNIDLSLHTNTPGATNNCAVDVPPTVDSTNPLNGAPDAPIGTSITINFSEPVAVSGNWFSINCTSSGVHTAMVSGGPQNYTLDPDVNFTNGESCSVTIFAANVVDQDGAPNTMTADYVFSFTAIDVCVLTYTPIYSIQGSGLAAAITGLVTTQGIVVGDYEGPAPALQGFYIQDAAGDGDATTSDGIFVFNGNNHNVNLGDVVRVSGTAKEFQDQTEIDSVTSIANCGTGTVAPTDVTMPFPSADYPERYEGMLVRLPQTLYVTEHFQLGRFGEILLSANGRLKQPTNVVAPGAPAQALQAANDLDKIILDDDLNNQDPDPILFGRGGNPLSASNTLRGGDTATGIVGLMTYTWAGNAASGNAYRVRPINALGGGVPNFQPTNPRPASPPAVGGSLRVVGMNLLNFFNTFDGPTPSPAQYGCTGGVGGVPMDCRGADDAAEFDRQWPKTVAAILNMNPDIVGVNEIENDGYGPDSAIQFLVNKLNDATAPGTYALIDVDAGTGQVNALGTDAIKVGMIYKPANVTPVGQTAALNSVAFVNGGDGAPRSRPSLAQAFEQNSNGERFVVDLNHLKSKGSACDVPDAGDGQGNCNAERVNAANALMTWLAADPTGAGDPDVLMLGDYNSYALEDPITVIKTAGFTNLIDHFIGADAYSYVFDGQWGYLDHAFGSLSILSQVTGVGEYHINSDEPSVLDYNTDFKTANLISTLYAPDQFRISDHDPVVVGLNLDSTPPTTSAQLTGTAGANGWYWSDVQVTLTADDGPDGSGIALTEYSVDNGTTWQPYSAPFTIGAEGVTTLLYRSKDHVGNQEIAQSLDVKIDRIAPEADLSFDPAQRRIELIGSDTGSGLGSVSPAVLSKGVRAYVITDVAGHTLSLSLRDIKLGPLETVSVLGLTYDSAATIVPTANLLSAAWNTGSILRTVDQVVAKDDNFWANASWLKLFDRTTVISRRLPNPVSVTHLPGLVSLHLITHNGALDFTP
jgi:predicted extracellular nuclease